MHVPLLTQGLGSQLLIFILQLVPVKPGGQRHSNPEKVLLHVPPFKQGLGIHSSAKISHDMPVNRGGQEHIQFVLSIVPPLLQVRLHTRMKEDTRVDRWVRRIKGGGENGWRGSGMLLYIIVCQHTTCVVGTGSGSKVCWTTCGASTISGKEWAAHSTVYATCSLAHT